MPETDVVIRLRTAMERLEGREPTMVLRRLRMEIEQLGASALGVSGPMGRLVGSLALLVPGGFTTLAAVAGIGAVGVEIRHLWTYAEGAEKALLKMNEAAAGTSGTRAGRLLRAQALEGQIDELRKPGGSFLGGLMGGRGMFGERGWSGDQTIAEDQIRAAQRATLENQRLVELDAFHREHIKVLEEHARKVQAATLAVNEHVIALDKARLGAHPSALALFDLATQSELMKNALSELDPIHKARINQLIGEARIIERLNLIATERNNAMVKAGFQSTTPMTSWELEAFMRGERADVFRDRANNLGAASFTQTGILPPGTANLYLGDQGRFGVTTGTYAGQELPAILRGHQGEERPRPTIASANMELGRNIGLGMAAALAAAGGLSRGGGGAVSGLGGAASALSGISYVNALGKTISPLAALGPVGAVLGGLGGLISLFGHHKPTVTVDAYGPQALQQMREMRGDPLTTSWVFVGPGDIRATQYALGRLQRRDAVTRLP